jgi:hypothetical protein
VLRCAVITIAVAALAQPACVARGTATDAGGDLARAIVIDTSASMTRETSPGVRAVDAARREAAELGRTAAISRVVESAMPIEVIGASVNWLSTVALRRELVIVSDFPRGRLDQVDLSRVPGDIGIRPVPIPASGRLPSAGDAGRGPSVTILAADVDRPDADAAWRAAAARGAPATAAADRAVAVAFPGDSGGTPTIDARPFDQPWMFDIVAAVSADPLSYLFLEGLSWRGGVVDGRPGVVLVTSTPADSLAAAALMTAAARAAAGQRWDTGRLADAIPADELATWTREAAPSGTARTGDPAAHGRWLWAAVLALLAIESVVRRRPGADTNGEGRLERAA